MTLLIGNPPPADLGFSYVSEPPYDQILIGSLTLGQLLCFSEERVLSALAQGIPVYLYTPGLPTPPKRRPIPCAIPPAQRTLKPWGILFTDGGRKHLITATEAQRLRQQGQRPAPGAVLTPLAREILEETK